MRVLNFIFLVACVANFSTIGLAQFTPPGLGKATTGEWFAAGVKQSLDKKHSITSSTFVGIERTTQPMDYKLFEPASLYVINQEISHHFKTHWKYAGAVSYRWQDGYKSKLPSEMDSALARQEIRLYGKMSYKTSIKRFKFSLTYRPELRLFYHPDFSVYSEPMQFRSRFRGKMSIYLNESKTQKIVSSAELLFASSKQDRWEKWNYTESRFCLYYSIALPNKKVNFNVGYMNELMGNQKLQDSHCLAFEIAVKNPFSK